eukprot:5607034-Pyramimonas_sp.AAC.1
MAAKSHGHARDGKAAATSKEAKQGRRRRNEAASPSDAIRACPSNFHTLLRKFRPRTNPRWTCGTY